MLASKQIAFGKAAGAAKPYAYEVEYLELDSHGEGVGITLPQIDTSKFDIGYTFKTSMYCEVEPQSSGTGRFILHLGGTSQYNAPIFVGNTSGVIMVFSSGIGSHSFPQASTLENYTFSLVGDRMTTTNDTTGDAITYKWTTNPFSDTGLFYSGPSSILEAVYRIGATQMLCGTEMLFDAIPVVSFDGVVCFYDRVSKSLVMPNEGWTFIAGPVVLDGTVWVDGEYYNTYGVETALEGASRCENYISVEPSSSITFFFGYRPNGNTLFLIQCDSNLQRIDSNYNGNGSARTITLGTETKYIRISCSTAEKGDVYVLDNTNNRYLVQNGEVVAGVDDVDYTAKDYVQDGLIRQVDAIETTGYGKEVYDNGTTLVDLANDADSGITIGTNVSRDGVLLDVISSISNGVFKSTPTQNVSDAFINDTFSLEFCGIINNNMVGTYDTAGNGYRLCNVQHSSASQPFIFFAGGESFSATLPNTDKAKTVSITRNGDVCSAYANGEFLGTFTASMSVVPNLLGFYIYEGQSMGSYRFYSRALTDEEIAYNYSIDKARFGL